MSKFVINGLPVSFIPEDKYVEKFKASPDVNHTHFAVSNLDENSSQHDTVEIGDPIIANDISSEELWENTFRDYLEGGLSVETKQNWITHIRKVTSLENELHLYGIKIDLVKHGVFVYIG